MGVKDRIAGGGGPGLCHFRMSNFRKCVILGFSKNIPYWAISLYLDVLCMSMHLDTIKISIFLKLNKFFQKPRNVSQFEAAALKMCHCSHFYHLFGTFGA